MRLLQRALIAGLSVVSLILPGVAHANAPALQIKPLLYEDTLAGTVKNGHIDVANPTDAPVSLKTSVRGFRQVGNDGSLSFYDDPELEAAIKVDLKEFELGPREAVRVLFAVDSAKLPQGGVYAAIFFRTQPNEKAGSNSSFVSQSANVGTLLSLQNGGSAPSGSITGLSLPFWQFGKGLHGSVTVHNTGTVRGGLAFHPDLAAQVLPWGRVERHSAGLVLPTSSRNFVVYRPGSFFGLLPIKLSDARTGASKTAWVVACTGWYSWLLLVLAIAGLLLLSRRYWRLRPWQKRHQRPPAADPVREEPVESAESPESTEVPSEQPKVPETLKHKVKVSHHIRPRTDADMDADENADK